MATPNSYKTNALIDAILQSNLSFMKWNSVWADPSAGTAFHRIDGTLATALAKVISLQCVAYAEPAALQLPICFYLACIAIESRFDPQCQNGNFHSSNLTHDPAGYDVGIAQLKLKYLAPALGVDVPTANTYALNPEQALPYMAKLMRELVQFATALIGANAGDSAILPAFCNPWLVATCAYNFGETGMAGTADSPGIFQTATEIPAHGKLVIELEQGFCKQLGLPSVFASISG